MFLLCTRTQHKWNSIKNRSFSQLFAPLSILLCLSLHLCSANTKAVSVSQSTDTLNAQGWKKCYIAFSMSFVGYGYGIIDECVPNAVSATERCVLSCTRAYIATQCVSMVNERKRAISFCHSHLYKMPYYLFDLEIFACSSSHCFTTQTLISPYRQSFIVSLNQKKRESESASEEKKFGNGKKEWKSNFCQADCSTQLRV